MKRIFISIIFLFFSGLVQAQVKMEILHVEIRNGTESQDSTGLPLSSSNPRIKLIMIISNIGIKNFVFYGIESRDEFDAAYRYKRKWRTDHCEYFEAPFGYFQEPSPQVLFSGEEMEVFLAFQLPKSFPQENYMEAFFDILPTLRVKLTRMEDGEELWTVFSEPINWDQLSVRKIEGPDLIL